jgi:hypothetical protein
MVRAIIAVIMTAFVTTSCTFKNTTENSSANAFANDADVHTDYIESEGKKTILGSHKMVSKGEK